MAAAGILEINVAADSNDDPNASDKRERSKRSLPFLSRIQVTLFIVPAKPDNRNLKGWMPAYSCWHDGLQTFLSSSAPVLRRSKEQDKVLTLQTTVFVLLPATTWTRGIAAESSSSEFHHGHQSFFDSCLRILVKDLFEHGV